MKKLFTALALSSIGFATAQAQEISINPELSLTYNGLWQGIDAEARTINYQFGTRVGALVDFQFGDHFSVSPGLMFNYNSGANTYGERYFYTGSNIPASSHDDRTYKMHYLSLPVFAIYKTKNEYNDPHAFFGIGPSFNFAIAGKFEQEYKEVVNGRSSVQNYSYNMPYGDNLRFDRARPFDIWANAFAGFQTSFGMYFKAQYGIGLLNIAPQGDANNYLRNSSFAFTVGYNIVVKKQYAWY